MQKYLSSLIIIFFFGALFGQESTKYLKVKIDLIGHEHSELAGLGIECNHGEIALHKHIINVYSEEELRTITDAGFQYTILIDDVQEFYKKHGTDDHRILEFDSREASCDVEVDGYNFKTPENYAYGSMGGYLTYDEALVELDKMHELYPDLITKRMAIGDFLTHEGRELYYMVISDDPENIDEQVPQVYYTALHHAREPNSLSQLIFYMWYVLENYETDEEVKFLVDNTAMFFQPIINPDGYVFNEITNPDGGGLWRKNRYANPEGEIVGVDLNRNYGFEWAFDNQGSSPNEYSQTYRGPSAFSEPETQATRKLCIDNNFQIILNYHTSGNLLIHPWGFSDEPTDEDVLFKSLGRTMISENDFLMGTASETVGYIVNGTSDDYMYGEQTEKNKSYTYTPEVGPTFWPGEDRIDQLNKSTVRMNLNAAHTLLSYAYAKELNPIEALTTKQGIIMFELEKSGLREGPIGFSVESGTPGLSLTANEFSDLQMTYGETRTFDIPFTIDDNFTGSKVKFITLIDNGDYIHRTVITKPNRWSNAESSLEYFDPISSINNYDLSGEWGLTEEDFASAPYSITDSPNNIYQNNLYSEIILNTTFDLSEATAANFKFHTKFMIENNYDFVQIQVSADGNDFIPLCGMYTNPAVPDQLENAEPLYDGVQIDWVQERICLDDFIGNDAVVVKFTFQSDNFVGADGFYFDNVIFETFGDGPVSVTEVPLDVISIMPNPSQDFIQLNMNPQYFKDNMTFELYDMLGKQVLSGAVDHPNKKLEIAHLESGSYVFRINVEERLFSSGKFVKH